MPQERFDEKSIMSSPSYQQFDRFQAPVPQASIPGTVAPGATSHEGPHPEPIGGEVPMHGSPWALIKPPAEEPEHPFPTTPIGGPV